MNNDGISAVSIGNSLNENSNYIRLLIINYSFSIVNKEILIFLIKNFNTSKTELSIHALLSTLGRPSSEEKYRFYLKMN